MNQKNKGIIAVDAETDGLYGQFLSVAAVVSDYDGMEVARFYAALDISKEDIQNEWAREHVFAQLKNADVRYETETDLTEAFSTREEILTVSGSTQRKRLAS